VLTNSLLSHLDLIVLCQQILKQQQASGEVATFTGTPSEFSELSGRSDRARAGSKDKSAAASGGPTSRGADRGNASDRRQTAASIATEADGSWARKTLN